MQNRAKSTILKGRQNKKTERKETEYNKYILEENLYFPPQKES